MICRVKTRFRKSAIVAFSLAITLTNNAKAERPDYGQIAIDGMIKGMLLPLTNGDKELKNVNKSIKKELFNPDGTGKIETKDGSVKIDTKDAESMKKADEFRKNYKKPPECFEPNSEEIRIKCANAYIRARKTAMN